MSGMDVVCEVRTGRDLSLTLPTSLSDAVPSHFTHQAAGVAKTQVAEGSG
jgi:hypothetical protein